MNSSSATTTDTGPSSTPSLSADQQLAELGAQIDGAIQILMACPHEGPRQIAIGNLNGYSEKLWTLAANDPKLFGQAKILDDKIVPYRKKIPVRDMGSRAKQPPHDEVKKKLADLGWDKVERLNSEDYWRSILGAAAIFRRGATTGEIAPQISAFVRAAVGRCFLPGAKVSPLILVGSEAGERAARLSPACLPAPYKTSVGHLVPARASLVTLFDGVGSSLDAGPFGSVDEVEDEGLATQEKRWFAAVAFVKRPTPIAESAGYILCQGEAPGAADMDQVWAEAYRLVYADSGR